MSPTRCLIPESATKGSATDGDRNPSRTVDPDHDAAAAAVRISHGDADHHGRHDLSVAGHCDGHPGALACAARSAAAGAGAAVETLKRAILARYRRLRPRPVVTHHLRRP